MATFQSLVDSQCGTTNSLVNLSQIYNQNHQERIQQFDQSISVPNTFHLQNLLSHFQTTDRSSEWTREFLQSNSNDTQIQQSPSLVPLFPSYDFIDPIPSFFDHQPDLISTEFQNDLVQSTQNILSFLHEKELENKTEEHRIDKENYFQQGLKCLEIHDLANAIQCFKFTVQHQPEHIDAWLCLGITLTEYEQDTSAIFALKKCLELDPKNLLAYLTLASCYANEMSVKDAYQSLYKWLENNVKYATILLNAKKYSSVYDELNFQQLESLFLQAVLISNNSKEIDSDLQICLGILYFLNNDYSKSSECFYTAVLARPHDALIWNKLGASIANGGENEKAVRAYYEALNLSPGYVRARYNLGLCALNLDAYEQAIEHFLIALKLQMNSQTTENIWRMLELAVNRLKRSDLISYVLEKDLQKLLDVCHISDDIG